MSNLGACLNCTSTTKGGRAVNEECSYDWKMSSREWAKLVDDGEKAVSSVFPSDSEDSPEYCKWQLLWKCATVASVGGEAGSTSSRSKRSSSKKTAEYAIFLRLTSELYNKISLTYSISCIKGNLSRLKAENCKTTIDSYDDVRVLVVSPRIFKELTVIRIRIDAFIQPIDLQCSHILDSAFLKQVTLLYQKAKWSDITLKVDGKEIKVHRIILSTHSSAFAALLKTSSAHIFEIKDFDYDIMLKVIQFMYLSKIDIRNFHEAELLLSASDVYGMQGLKIYISTYLNSSTQDHNAVQLFMNAYMCNADALKSSIGRYIVSSPKHFEYIESYNTIKNQSAILIQLSANICRAISSMTEEI